MAAEGVQILVRGIRQFLQGSKVASLPAAACQFGKEIFHRVHPVPGGWVKQKCQWGCASGQAWTWAVLCVA